MKASLQKYIVGDTAVNIAESIERLIAQGRAAPGDRLPPVRELARSLTVSPSTVSSAYAALRRRGLLDGQRRQGTRIARRVEPLHRPSPVVTPGQRNLADGNPDPALLPPYRAVLRSLDPTPRLYGGALHDPGLLAVATERLGRDRIPTEHLAVTSGAMDGIERVLRAHLRRGDPVAVEDPGFFGVHDLLRGLGLPLLPVSLDREGPDPDGLAAAIRRGARAAVLTPRAQNPTGLAWSSRRQRALAAVLAEHPHLLWIEDDHVADIAGAPHRTAVRGHHGPWAVVRSASKALGPDLRVALVASDAVTHARTVDQQRLGARWVSHVLQRIVAGLWSRRGSDAGFARATARYAERRRGLVQALAEYGIDAWGESGLNVWIPVPEESTAVAHLAAQGWGVVAGEPFRIESGPALRVTVSTLSAADARRFARDLAAARPGDATRPGA